MFGNLKKTLLILAGVFIITGCSNNDKSSPGAEFPVTVANPPGGNYPASNPPFVTLQCNKPATIYYTLNGAIPEIGRSYTLSGRSPVTGIEIKQDTTLRFFAVDDDGNQESVKTEVYTIDPPPLTTAAPRGGTFNKPVRVSLVASEDAITYYTLDGSTPDQGSFQYSGPILITREGVTVLKFFSVDLLGNKEDVKTEQYIIDTTPPSTRAIPAGGRNSGGVNVTLLADEPASIYYRICNGEYNPEKCPDPEPSDPDVSVGDTTVSGVEIATGVLKFFAMDRAGNQESTKTEVYLTGNTPYTSAYPSTGLFRAPQLILLYTDVVSGATATIYYTLDGSTPDTSSSSCMSPCEILIYSEGTTELKFFAVDSFGNTEPVRSETYTIDSIPPTTAVSPPGGEYIGPQNITLSSSEPGTIYYTLDGSVPVPGASNTLSGVSPVTDIIISGDTTIKFYSMDTAGNVESSVKTANFSILYRFVEEFSTDDYKDNANTDATWNTQEGKVLLTRNAVPVIKSMSTGGNSYAMDIYGNHLFLASGTAGLKIYDISFPSDPQQSGVYPAGAGETFFTLRIRNNILFAGTSSGIVVLDVSDASNPVFVSRWNIPDGEVMDIKFYGKYILISGGSSGFWIIDPSDLYNLTTVAHLALTDSSVSIEHYGSTVYVADSQGDVKVIDISNPTNPVLVRTVSFPGGIVSVTHEGTRLFAGGDNGIIYLMELRDPSKPLFVSSTNAGSRINCLNVMGNYLYAGTQGGVKIIDFSNALYPAVLSSVEINNVNSVIFSGNYIFSSGDTLNVITAVLSRAPVLYPYVTGFSAKKLTIMGSYALVSAGSDGVKILDLSNPQSIQVAGGYSGGGSAESIALYGNYGLVAYGSSGLVILKVDDPSNVFPVSSVSTSDFTHDVIVYGGYAIIADGTNGVRIIDISNITAPAEVGSCAPDGTCLPMGSRALRVRMFGGYLIAGLSTSEIAIIDISNIASPVRISIFSTTGVPGDVLIKGNYIYSAGGTMVEIFNITNPFFPLFAGSISVPNSSVTGLLDSGNSLYIADGSQIHFADITDPGAPFIYRSVSVNSYAIARFGEYLLVTDGSSGARSMEVSIISFYFKSPQKAVSINVNKLPYRISSGKIKVNEDKGTYGEIAYYLSNDAGNTWMGVTPGDTLKNFSSPGSDLRFMVVLSTNDPRKTPILDKLEVYFKYEN